MREPSSWIRVLMFVLFAGSAACLYCVGKGAVKGDGDFYVPRVLLADRGIYSFDPTIPQVHTQGFSLVLSVSRIHFRGFGRNIFIEMTGRCAIAGGALVYTAAFPLWKLFDRRRVRRNHGA
jgi:hypothetical protein